VLHAGVRLSAGVTLGADCVVHSNTVIRHDCTLGQRVILHQNVSVGADGFGYRPAPDGRGLVKVPHIGSVRIEDDVEIGAGTCIDRGKFGATVIGTGTKIDNLVQIGHNCRIGRCCIIVSGCGLAGSVVLEDGVILGGQVGIADGVRVGAGVQVGAKSGLMKDIPPGEKWLGVPADQASATLRQWAAIRKLPGLLGGIETQLKAAARKPRRDAATD
jgi:UDP-3-O-[3-hydroxymyristoyl] glucosamine N-acyltransferase